MTDNQKPMGRPTDFRPEMGEEILALMSTGLSLAAAAAEIGIHRQRVYEWVDRHPEFADTVKLAQVKRQAFLEKRLLNDAATGPVVTSTIFALKNAGPEDWRDKRELDLQSSDGSMTPKPNVIEFITPQADDESDD
ncbi:hypothetical protein [Bartonella sp. LJL80]